MGCVKLFLLRREYFLLAVNELTNRPKIFDIAKKDFFQHNFLHTDQ